MAADHCLPMDDALAPLPAGRLHWLRVGELEVALAPEAGGRIAQIRYAGVDWLVAEDDAGPAAIGWGCYPMVPWAGRIRRGGFIFDGRSFTLPANFGAHAIHGVGFSLPWHVDSFHPQSATLSLALPNDAYWPFGGVATQSVHVGASSLQLQLMVEAGDQAMPAELGWHPWFRKPDHLLFTPDAMYPRDEDGIATLPLCKPPPGPWDDCFVANGETVLLLAGQRLRLRSNADHWVVYDGAAHATCLEPQTGPPDAFTLAPRRLAAGQRLTLTFELAWEIADS